MAAGVFGAATNPGVIVLAAAGNSIFSVTFVLPPDYDNNGKVEVVMLMTNTGGECAARIVPTQLFRYRADLPFENSLSGVNGGNPVVSFAGGSLVVKKVFAITKGSGMAGQRRGDALEILVTRQGDDVTDTCGNVFVRGIEIRYPLAP
jgi:hypothetical protein